MQEHGWTTELPLSPIEERLTDLNSFWNRAFGSMFQAMVSVMAVKIQLSSPSGVLRSVCLPGIRSMSSFVIPSCRRRLREQNHRRATCG